MMQPENLNIEDNVKDESLKCRRCGRKLKNPESIELGFGVICYQKYQNRKKLIPLFIMPKKGETEEMDERTAQELASKTEKIKKLETKVKDLRDDNKIKDCVIAELVDMLPADTVGNRATVVKSLNKSAKKKLSR